MTLARRLLAGLALVVLLAACAPPPDESPTPTLIVLGKAIPTSTHIPTILPLPSPSPETIYTRTPTIEPPPTKTPSVTPTASRTPLPGFTPGAGSVPVAVGCKGQLAGPNLLTNGGFEGAQHDQESGVQVPDGWTAFWRPIGEAVAYDADNPTGYQRPEMLIISKQPPYADPPRIADGSQAFMMTGNERAFDAGIYQQVTLAPGAVLCLSGLAHAWSSRFSDNPFDSTLSTGDDQRNANFQLGIDPNGGADPFAASVRWGDVQHLYDEFAPMSAVQASGSSPTVTVFVRGFMLWRFVHNEMFFDSISLVKVNP
jgi:hypothetical protein